VLDHVTLRVSDLSESMRFYDRLFDGHEGHRYVNEEGAEWDDFGFYAGPPVTRNLRIVLAAPRASAPAVDPDGIEVEMVARSGAIRFERLVVGVRSLDAARRFYEAIAPVVGLEAVSDGFRTGETTIELVESAAPTECLHVAFAAPDDATVREFHRVALAAGYRDNGPPGERLVYHPGYYGAFVLDPDGLNVEAVNHNR